MGPGRTVVKRFRTGERTSTVTQLWLKHAKKMVEYLRILDDRHKAVVALHKLEIHTALQESPISSVMFSPDRKLMTMAIHQEQDCKVPGPIGMRTGTNKMNAPLPAALTEVAKELQQTLNKLGDRKRKARMEVNQSINELRGFDAKEAEETAQSQAPAQDEETAQAQASAQDEEHTDLDLDAILALPLL